ncbi:SUMF1/EgtB/PvdO family nonheme iron enzyme (plasmid) [Nostoc edaphicum CCNP1411]|uniref:SUMF1/EgtB/PvdO family nonheme iron enzyme n=1 Tax=Nostoc edaphicum CCNP1411 TaxID=1472755 RepID=A0A7D7Q8X8_9NOSO|nr:SUMF1/EgtB/PvdO family nonheme iron enzyme [Nostoc edaphicum CCNP1411]
MPLRNPDVKVRIAALEQAVNYGEQGLDLVIAGLKDKSWDVQNAAYLILNKRTEPRIKQILQDPRQLGFKLKEIEVITVNRRGQIIQRQQRIARYFTEGLGNGVTLEMAAIPGGSFMMGSPESEAGRLSSESPRHQVTVPGFFIGKYELTQVQYQAIVGNNPSRFRGDNRPVENLSWYDAIKFCEKLSQKTGKTYRLPSEAEWEYACRAGSTTPFYFGENITPNLVTYGGNVTYAFAPENQEQTKFVGTFPPNAFGLYDTHGNVAEWCEDDPHNNYINAPNDGSAWINQSSGIHKTARGGSWYDNREDCRSARRYAPHADGSSAATGFRVVCDAA